MLNRKDAAATVIVGAAGALYGWHRVAPGAAVIGSTRWAGALLFVLGVAACATGGLLTGTVGRYGRAMSAAGGVAFALMVTTAATGSEAVLALLAALIAVLWLVTTARHLVAVAPPAPRPPVGRLPVR